MKLITLENLKSFWKDVKSYVDNGLSKKADSVHGTHVTYGTINGKAPGTASAGTSSKVAREDHVHPVQTTVSGNAGTATKLQTARTITLKGRANGSASFDGSGNIIIDTNPNMFESGGTSGKSGYVAIAQLKITGSYANRPTEFKLVSRGRGTACTVSVAFANADSTDPALSSIRYWGSDYGVFIHKSATSTWLLYVTKSEGYDSITVVDCCYGSQGITITYPGSFITEKPTSNITNASLGGSFGQANTANSATKATQDSAGQQINTTYIKGLSVNGKTITYTKGDGSTGTITTQDTNTTYSTGTASALGLTKLYTGTGTATDGTMTQSAIKTALDGKAASSHTHSYLPLSGGTLSGILRMENANYGPIVIRRTSGTTHFAGIKFENTAGYLGSIGMGDVNGGLYRYNTNENDRYLILDQNNYRTVVTPANIGAVAKTGDSMTGMLKIEKSGDGESLLHLQTERGWQFKQLSTGGDTKLGLVSDVSDKNFEILPPDLNNGVRIAVSNNTPVRMVVDGTVNATTVTATTFAGALSGNATTATTLQTARSINGTNFNGSANITTANWGTARTINGISVNGSTNYILPVENYYCNVGNNNTNLYHKILESGQVTGNWVDKSIVLFVTNAYQGGGHGIVKITLRTNDISSTANASGEIRWLVRSGFATDSIVFNIINQSKNVYMDVFYKCPGTHCGLTWYVLSEGQRGSNHSKVWTKFNTSATSGAYTEANMKTLRSYTATLQTGSDSGQVASANTLATARTINGTSFNGSANITTANWGTARNITVGNTTKSVNGSGNVAWTLAEIGAASSGHTHNYAGSSSAGGNANAAVKLATARTINGTSFDGSANITTANWGTARNIYIASSDGSGASSAVSVNGSGNATLKLPATIKATLSGNASTATTSNYLASNTRMDYGWNGVNCFNISGTAGNAAKANDTPTSAWWHIMRFNHANSSGFYTDLAIPFNDVSMYYKRITNGAVNNGGWVKMLDALNYNNYAPTKTGGGASGTWGISVSGNASTATKLATARTIKVGNTGKSFDGSGGITFTLAEVGIVSGTSAPSNSDGRANGTVYFRYA